MSRMVRVHGGAGYITEEERPYRRCPNCGEYDFRKIQKKRMSSDGFFDWLNPLGGTLEIYDEYEKCENCEFLHEGEDG